MAVSPWMLHLYACVHRVTLLHAVLPGDGVAVLRVVQKGHVDSDQRRPVSREDLTSDDWRQAAWANKQKELNKQTMPAGDNNCHPFASGTSREVWFTEC